MFEIVFRDSSLYPGLFFKENLSDFRDPMIIFFDSRDPI